MASSDGGADGGREPPASPSSSSSRAKPNGWRAIPASAPASCGSWRASGLTRRTSPSGAWRHSAWTPRRSARHSPRSCAMCSGCARFAPASACARTTSIAAPRTRPGTSTARTKGRSRPCLRMRRAIATASQGKGAPACCRTTTWRTSARPSAESSLHQNAFPETLPFAVVGYRVRARGAIAMADHNDPNAINSIFSDIDVSAADLYDIFGFPSDDRDGGDKVLIALTFAAIPQAGTLDSDLLYRIRIAPDRRITRDADDKSLAGLLRYFDGVKKKYLSVLKPAEVRVTVDPAGR